LQLNVIFLKLSKKIPPPPTNTFVQSKVAPLHATKAYRSTGRAPLLDGNELRARATVYPGERNPVPINYEAHWALEPVWTFWRRVKSLVLAIPYLVAIPSN
jgi:hypothetical protein